MFLNEWDRMEEDLATLAIEQGMPLTTALGHVCRKYPDYQAREALLAAISVATQIDLNSGGLSDTAPEKLLRHYKAVVALTADVIALKSSARSCADLVHLWDVTGDTVFLPPDP